MSPDVGHAPFDLLLHFWITGLAVKLDTSNLVHRMAARFVNQKKCKSGSRGTWPTSRDLLS